MSRWTFIFISIVLFFLIISQTNSYSYFQVSKHDSLEITTLLDSSFVLRFDDHKKAVALCNQVLDKAVASESSHLLKKALYISAYLDWFNGDHIDAIRKSKGSLLLAAKLNDTVKVAENQSLIGLIHLYTSNYDSALNYFELALNNFTLLKDTTRILKVYGFEGIVYNKQGDYIKSKENLLRTVLLKRSHGTQDWSVINIEENEDISKKYYNESLINAKQTLSDLGKNPKASKKLRLCYQNLALTYLRLNYGDSALIYFKKSANISTELGIDVQWLEYARAYKKLGMYDSAIVCNSKAIEVSHRKGTNITLAMAHNQTGLAYNGLQEHAAAKKEFLTALRIHESMGHKNAQMTVMINVSDACIKLGQLEEALSYANSSFSIAQTIGSRFGKVQALHSIYSLNKLNGHFKKALEIKLVHSMLLDSLQKKKVLFDLAKLDLYNEVELNKLEISDLNKQQALSDANLKNRTLIIVIISIIVLFVVLLLVLNSFKTNKLGRLNVELNHQQDIIKTQNFKLIESNKEKELLLGEIHHRVKNNLQTITSLLNIQQRKLKDPDTIKVLEDSKNRVMAMGLIHQHLYQNTSFAEIDFKNYTKELVNVLINTNACCEITVKCEIPDLKIELDNAIFFGLIINELAINSIKHAYDGVGNPLLEISIFKESGKMVLLVKDNGNKENIEFDKSNSFGWKMVNNICEKLEGELAVDNSDGLSIKILFNTDIIDLK